MIKRQYSLGSVCQACLRGRPESHPRWLADDISYAVADEMQSLHREADPHMPPASDLEALSNFILCTFGIAQTFDL